MSRDERVALEVQVVLVVMRLATMLGTRRAYEAPPLTYWFSPLADLPVARETVPLEHGDGCVVEERS